MTIDPIWLIGGAVLLVIAIVIVLRQRASGITTVSSAPERTPGMASASLPAELNEAAAILVGRDQKLEAIKLVRTRTGMGLKEAKDYVEALARGQSAARVESALNPTHPQAAPIDTTELHRQVQELLARGVKIEAIKLVRAHTGMGLKEAKDYVEELERR